MIRAKVITGRFCLGDPSLNVAPYINESTGEHYESVVNDIQNPSIFVLFKDPAAFPEYVIEYKVPSTSLTGLKYALDMKSLPSHPPVNSSATASPSFTLPRAMPPKTLPLLQGPPVPFRSSSLTAQSEIPYFDAPQSPLPPEPIGATCQPPPKPPRVMSPKPQLSSASQSKAIGASSPPPPKPSSAAKQSPLTQPSSSSLPLSTPSSATSSSLLHSNDPTSPGSDSKVLSMGGFLKKNATGSRRPC